MVGVVLEGLRVQAKMPLQRLARETHMSRETLRARLAGDPNIKMTEVEAICAALDVDPQTVWTTAAQAVA